MEKLYVGVEPGNRNAEAIIAAHIGRTIDELRAALKARFKYDPVEPVREDWHEQNLRDQGKVILTVDDDGVVDRA